MSNQKESGNNSGREMGISRLVNAPRELVWEVWTSPEHIKNWWGPSGFKNTIFKMEVKPGGEWEFIMHGPDGTDYKNKHIYKEVVKPSKLVLQHVTHPNFEMTVTFEEQGDKTLVTMHSMFESEEQLKEVIKVFKADVGMKQNIERMANYLEQHSQLQSKTMHSSVAATPLIIERTLNAPVEKVWHALTNSEAMKQWYFDIPGFKPEVGFEFQFTGTSKSGEIKVHLCKITEVIKNSKLKHSWRYQGHEGNSFVTFELFPEKDKTKLRLTHEGLETFPDTPAHDFAKGNFMNGWTYIIDTALKDFLEK